MDYSLISDMISNLGFPIVMVAYFIYDKYKSTGGLVTALENNTTILNKLCAKMDEEDLICRNKEKNE